MRRAIDRAVRDAGLRPDWDSMDKLFRALEGRGDVRVSTELRRRMHRFDDVTYSCFIGPGLGLILPEAAPE